MRLFLFFILILFFVSIKAEGQTIQYKPLLDSAINFTGKLFVNPRPITKIWLDEKEMGFCYCYYYSKDFQNNGNLDTLIFLQIVRNSKNIDPTSWTDTELDKVILVQDHTQIVELRDVIQKFKLSSKNKINQYKKIIDEFNLSPVCNKNIYSYSRPVFDDTKKFAIIQWENSCGGSWGGLTHSAIGSGGINLYQLIGSTWKELGSIKMWRY